MRGGQECQQGSVGQVICRRRRPPRRRRRRPRHRRRRRRRQPLQFRCSLGSPNFGIGEDDEIYIVDSRSWVRIGDLIGETCAQEKGIVKIPMLLVWSHPGLCVEHGDMFWYQHKQFSRTYL